MNSNNIKSDSKMDLTFDTKNIQFQSQSHKILLQNENGPCALVALVNLLLLSSSHARYSKDIIRLIQDERKVKLHDILQSLADIAINMTAETNELEDIDYLLLMLPDLHKGLNVNPRFNGSFGKSNQAATELFKVFKVRLVHGWIMGGEYDEIRDLSYEDAQDLLTKAADLKRETEENDNIEPITDENTESCLRQASLVTQFCNQTATQLTETGLLHLNETITEGEFTILFRNDHFSTLYKQNGILYNLVTDLGFKRRSKIVWESLITIDGSGDGFFDGHFKQSPFESNNTASSFSLEDSSDAEQIDKDQRYAKELQEEEDKKLAKDLTKKQQIVEQKKKSTHHRGRSSNSKMSSKKPEKAISVNSPSMKTNNSSKSQSSCILA